LKQLDQLLDLKQKQANAWETRFARLRAEETQKQTSATQKQATVRISVEVIIY
jgi:hypothetical protein